MAKPRQLLPHVNVTVAVNRDSVRRQKLVVLESIGLVWPSKPSHDLAAQVEEA